MCIQNITYSFYTHTKCMYTFYAFTPLLYRVGIKQRAWKQLFCYGAKRFTCGCPCTGSTDLWYKAWTFIALRLFSSSIACPARSICSLPHKTDCHRCDHLANIPLPKDCPLAQQAAVSTSLATYGVHSCPSAACTLTPLGCVLEKFASQTAGSEHINTFICNLLHAKVLKLQLTN